MIMRNICVSIERKCDWHTNQDGKDLQVEQERKKRDKKRYADKAERIAVCLGKIGLVVQTIIHQS